MIFHGKNTDYDDEQKDDDHRDGDISPQGIEYPQSIPPTILALA